MKKFYVLLLMIISNFAISQTINEIDSVSITMCNYLQTTRNIKNDTLRIKDLYETKFFPYLEKIDSSKVQKVGIQAYYRLQRNCVEFRNLLDRLEPPKEAVVRKTTKPVSKMTKKDSEKFKNQIKFKYFEVNGDTTYVTMQNNIWLEKFKDDTYSKLEYKWLNDTEFILTFIESNNETRSNFSIKGDQYIYYIISKEKDHYLTSSKTPGEDIYEEAKIYFE
ncbi:hypothetical protein J2Y38_002019 [Flavobacterium sp. 2755]|uniref:hypothetical protein n=1 Tax=Flavobacterium sp. 2755 TaxID=2817765 RepID=UPI002859D474|nr:hypothetical protein [Flavobacterium sp. 2755]MDR6761810.1 hypothetical protein [Flavobacterium sp. 2755]